ncbi:MAG: hypothetical protein ACI379_01220 [Nocardioides sp.]|uniref:hypothetical protein n=1 Tax=Nocardioides sp. TaxID=35761 RepID=UPI003F022E25
MLTARRFLATLLLLCGLAAVAVGVPSSWAKQSVLDTDRYTEAVAPLIEEPAVRATITDALVTAVESQLSVPDALAGPLRRVVAGVVGSDAFVPAWETAVRSSHEHAVAALRDEGKGLALDDGTLRVELAPLVEALVPRLEAAGIPGASALKRVNGTIELVSSPELATAARAASAVDRWGTDLLVAGTVLLLAAVLVSPRRGTTLVVGGLGLLVVSAVHLALFRRLTADAGADASSTRETAGLVIAALGDGAEGLVLATAVAGGVAVVLGLGVLLVSRRAVS